MFLYRRHHADTRWIHMYRYALILVIVSNPNYFGRSFYQLNTMKSTKQEESTCRF